MIGNQCQAFLRGAMFLTALTLFVMFFARGLIDPDEGRYAEIPREMAVSGKWQEMRMLGYRYYEKPPMAYWLTAPAIAAFGNRDWAARIPLAINILTLIFVLYRMLRRYWPDVPIAPTLLICLTAAGFTGGLAMLMTDPFLTVFFTLTCWWAYVWFFTPATMARRRYALAGAAGFAAAMGFITKGAVAVVLPAAIVFLWMVWSKHWRKLRISLPLTAGLICALLCCAGLAIIERHNPGFFQQFIWEEHIARFKGTREIQGHPEPWWFFLKVTPLLLLPWTLFLFRAIRNIAKKRVFATDDFSRFLAVWTTVVIVFFSISTGKLMSYILPAIPPLLLLLARWGIVEPSDGSIADRQLQKVGLAGIFITATALVAVWAISYFKLLPDDIHPVRGASIAAFIPLTLALAATLPRLRLASNCFHQKTLFLGSALMLTVALMLSPLAGKDFNVTAHLNSSLVYKAFAAKLTPSDKIVVFWSYRPSLPFYTGRIYRPFQEQNELRYGMRREPERPAEIKDCLELQRFIKESAPAKVYGLIEPEDFKRFTELGLPYRPAGLPTDPLTIIVELQPQ